MILICFDFVFIVILIRTTGRLAVELKESQINKYIEERYIQIPGLDFSIEGVIQKASFFTSIKFVLKDYFFIVVLQLFFFLN